MIPHVNNVKVTDLSFEAVETVAHSPYFTCSMCGKRTKLVKGSHCAEYHFCEDAHHAFILCSPDCYVKFHGLPYREHVNKYINNCINLSIDYYNKSDL